MRKWFGWEQADPNYPMAFPLATVFMNPRMAVGLEIDAHNPQVMYAGFWRFDRNPWAYTSGSDHGGVFKSQDGGLIWHKLTADLPNCWAG